MTMNITNRLSVFPSLGMLIGCLMAFSANAVNVPELDCVIEPHMVIDLSSRTDGIVEDIKVERGDFVTADQVLVQLESGVERAAVEYAREAAEAYADVLAGQVSTDFAQRRRGRLEVLYRDQAVSSDQMDEIETEATLSKLNYRQAKERNKLAELELQRAQEVLERHTMRSPIDGVVVKRFLAPGESVEEKPVLRLAQINPLRIEVIAPVSYFGAFAVGQEAVVTPERPIKDSFRAKVSVVDRVADAASGTFRVRLSLPNPEHKLPSGLNCRVRFLEKPLVTANVSPVQPPEPTQPPQQPEPAKPPELGAVCQSIGPITDLENAQSLKAVLSERATRISLREEASRQSNGFIVTSSDQGSVADAEALADKLRAAGFSDLYVFSRGAYKNRVSYGLYNNKRPAIAREKQMESAGFLAETRKRHRKVNQYWVDVSGSADLAANQAELPDSARKLLVDLDVVPAQCDEMVAAVNEQ